MKRGHLPSLHGKKIMPDGEVREVCVSRSEAACEMGGRLLTIIRQQVADIRVMRLIPKYIVLSEDDYELIAICLSGLMDELEQISVVVVPGPIRPMVRMSATDEYLYRETIIERQREKNSERKNNQSSSDKEV